MPKVEHVAIVDDDAITRAALARLLNAHDIDCRVYASADEFLAALPTHTPDCLVVDVEMPAMTGLELRRELSRLGARIPTIVMTGHDSDSYRNQSRQLGVSAYLLKPMDSNALIAAIDSAVAPGGGNA
jgi:FixJ family two-component response regulator